MIGALRIVTWNVWFGEWQRELRRRSLFEWLAALRPDVVCLQEVVPGFVGGGEVAALRDRGAWVSESDAPNYDTLMFSRLRVRDSERVALPSEMGRNLLLARLDVDPPLTVATVHLESTKEMTAARVRQLEAIKGLLADDANVALVGDMNFPDGDRPEAAALSGWRDAWHDLRSGEPGFTVDSERNEMRGLAKPGRKRARLDRAFVRGDGWRVVDIELLGTEHLAGDPLTFVSDHFGLKIDLVPARNLAGS